MLERLADSAPEILIFTAGLFLIVRLLVVYFVREITRAIKDLNRSNDRVVLALAKLTQVILYHDATVKGENPKTLGSPTEIISKIINDVKNGRDRKDENRDLD
ncbi:MAG: hypothetical protein D6698_03975 [Gammaproteobacteria bacterium]|nr:MAG: hypothetical protein D6698_03975 [Gammaproteobacteria bacterium]